MFSIVNFINNKKFKNKDINCYIRINFSFYKYFYIKNIEQMKNKVKKYFHKLNIFGRIYISHEGINVQGNILKKFFYKMKKYLNIIDSNLKNIYINIGINNIRQGFFKLKIKIKNKLVSDNIKLNFIKYKYNPKYLFSKDVNNFLDDKKIIFLDVRNYYEYKIGHFKNAISINTVTFKELLKNIFNYINLYKNNKIVLYCTGGIRCEKTAFLMNINGYNNVYQIYGGIIGYVRDCIKNNIPIKFLGKNFVFDFRMTEKISEDILSTCYQCKKKSDYYINCMNPKCNLLFIQCILCSKLYKSFCSKKCYKYKNIFTK